MVRLRGSGGVGMALYLREVAPYLAVVCVVRDSNALSQQGGHQGAWDGDDLAEGSGGDAFPLLQPPPKLRTLPRSGLSVPHQATINFNIAAVARAIAALFEAAAAVKDGTTVVTIG